MCIYQNIKSYIETENEEYLDNIADSLCDEKIEIDFNKLVNSISRDIIEKYEKQEKAERLIYNLSKTLFFNLNKEGLTLFFKKAKWAGMIIQKLQSARILEIYFDTIFLNAEVISKQLLKRELYILLSSPFYDQHLFETSTALLKKAVQIGVLSEMKYNQYVKEGSELKLDPVVDNKVHPCEIKEVKETKLNNNDVNDKKFEAHLLQNSAFAFFKVQMKDENVQGAKKFSLFEYEIKMRSQ